MDLGERVLAARAAWPDLDLPDDELRAMLEQAPDPTGQHDADLLLARACARQAPGALAAFERVVLPAIVPTLSRFRPSSAFVDEVRQILREKLFVGASPRIAEYAGKGPLVAWLRVAALRTALDLKRARGESESLPITPESLADPALESGELAFLKAEYRPLVKDAFQRGLAQLDSDQRNLLRLHLVDQLTLDEIGRMFGLNRSTIFRRIGNAREQLVETARLVLCERLGGDGDEFDSLVGLVRSRLDLSLSRILRP